MPDARLPFDTESSGVDARIDARDRDGRTRAVDPRFNVVLEASAGTGKTRILVDRYVNLLRAGVDPSNILAMTFTRKAAAEMRERILGSLRSAAERGEIPRARWRELRDRTGDIEISTIDAFCLSLLREFPLEADLDPGFTVADDTEVPRLVDEALDRALGICRGLAREDEHVALVLAQLGDRRLRGGLAALLSRRIVAPRLLGRLLGRTRPDLTVVEAAARATEAVLEVFASMVRQSTVRLKPDATYDTVRLKPDATTGVRSVRLQPDHDEGAAWSDGLHLFVATGPADPAFMILVGQLEGLALTRQRGLPPEPAAVRAALDRISGYFLTGQGTPRKRLSHAQAVFPSPLHWKRHRNLVVSCAPRIAAVLAAHRRDLNALLARGVWRIFRIAEAEYQRTLDAHGVLDFSDLLLRTRQLLGQMEEFSRSRYKLESRYHHVLVDEFQDTSRAQWELVSLLVQSWGEGAGLTDAAPLPPSIFIVGDSKQSIYSFRDADVSVLADAARALEGLRPDGDVRRSISRSFRAVPGLLSFVNDVCHDLEKVQGRVDAFRYDELDHFPVGVATGDSADVLGAIVADGPQLAAEAVADEVHRLISTGAVVRDVASGVPRPVVASDIAILFRTRESHRAVEEALGRRHVPAYVYKGLGFFDTNEIRDVLATLWHLAEPCSNLRAAAWLRSGFVRLSDEGLRRLGPRLGEALTLPSLTAAAQSLDDQDARALATARDASARWRALVDRITPAELVDLVLSDSAYAIEMRGYRFRQARENLKKIRSLVRRIQSKGYATLARIVSHLDRLALGDESNAPIDARGAVSLMTVHAAKGLEFPIVFVVNLTTGAGGRRPPIHLMDRPDGQASMSIGDFDSTLDEDEAAREREETKRLLYVALTRARDRLYLSATTRNGRLQPGRGSLAEVLPVSLTTAVGNAASGAPICWQASSGAVHPFRSCAGPVIPPPRNFPSETEIQIDASDSDERDFLPLERGKPYAGACWIHAPDALIGHRLVHRLLARLGLPGEAPNGHPSLAELVERLLAPDERELVVDLAQLVSEVSSTYEALARRSDLGALYENGAPFYEVPVSFDVDGVPVTATVGCLIRTPGADASGTEGERLTILEFMTGQPMPDHREETHHLCRAVRDAFPGVPVSACLVYSSGLVTL